MGSHTVIPFGPQHPVLPEPVHLDLELEDEKVIRAIPSIGYVHRGLEKLVEKRQFTEYVYVAERICGICSFGHGWGYCKAVEGNMNIEVPPRARYLRTIWHELSRLHSHLLWLGLLADGMGFESLFMNAWRLREQILDIFEATTGGRVIFSVCKVGGVRRDIDNSTLRGISQKLLDMRAELKRVTDTFFEEPTAVSRLRGVGVLSREKAQDLCCVGPMARASGIPLDIRMVDTDGAYQDLNFQPCLSNDGDCYARCRVRVDELFTSIDLIRQAVEKIPEGDLSVPVKGNPAGEFFTRIEQPRGEALYYVKGNGTKYLDRMRVRTPTNINIPALVQTLQGCDFADVPMLILTIDPCISCTER
ncbi:MAG: nickel-dependent hydrogenase large subunit [Oscillospiraceae bacterium]|jgi:ech hydrogenase subunit E|nr:nickel-dependent hydrogenase large subunit [Oscillospiraceae bacterium]